MIQRCTLRGLGKYERRKSVTWVLDATFPIDGHNEVGLATSRVDCSVFTLQRSDRLRTKNYLKTAAKDRVQFSATKN